MNLPTPTMTIDEFHTLRKKVFLNILKYSGIVALGYLISRGISIMLGWNVRWFG